MAQIRLVVNTDLKQAKAAVDTLKTSFADLAKQLSTITVNKNLTAQLNALTKYYDSVANAGARAAQQTRGTAANVETLRRGYANLINQLNTLQKQYASGTFDTARKSIEQNFEAVKKLSQAQEVNGDEVKRLSEEYKRLAADVAQFRAEGEKLKTSDPFSPKQGDSIFRLQKQYASLLNSIKSAEQYYPKGTFDGIAKGAQEAVTGLQALGQEYTTTGTLSDASQKQLNAFSEGLNRQRAAFETTKNSAQNYHGTLRDIIQGFIKFQLSASIVMNSIQLIRGAFNSLNETLVETEKVVVSIQRVLDETVEGGEIADKLYDIAERLGQTFDNVQEIAQNFAKAGLSWQETLEATEAAVLALNVAELTAEESSEGLIAVMQQFNYEASELVNVIDVLNKAADKSAVDTQELLVALQKTGSYAAAANLSLEQTVGLISALSEATAASGQNIGNALKSLFSYTTRDSSLDTFASLSEDMNKVVEEYRLGAASILDVWEQLSIEMQSLDAQQADALSQWTESSGLDAELEGELSEIYDSLTGVYDSAGVYRKNYFIALMNNFEEVKEVMGEISDAQGYTAEEQAKYMDTYEAKLNSLQAQWQHLANDEQGWLAFKKGLLDVGSALLTVIEWTGGLRTTVIALGTVFLSLFGGKIVKGLKSIATGFKNILTPLKNFQKYSQLAAEAQKAQATATELQAIADEKNAAVQALKNSQTASAAAIEAAETAAVKANTNAQNANAIATQKASVATKAFGTAVNTALGVVGLIAMAISAVVGVFQSVTNAQEEAAEKAREAREETLSEWDAVADQATNLADLTNRYEELNKITDKTKNQEEEFASIQEEIIELLGEKANVLDRLTEGTDEYNKKLEELTKEQIRQYALQAQSASNAAFEELKNLGEDASLWGGAAFKEAYKKRNELEKTGIDLGFYRNLVQEIYGSRMESLYGDNDITDRDILRALYGSYDPETIAYHAIDDIEAMISGLYEGGYADTSVYTNLYNAFKDLKENAISSLTAIAQNEAWKYVYENGFPETREEIDKIINSVVEATGATDSFIETIEETIYEITGYIEAADDATEGTDALKDAIANLSDKAIEGLIEALEEARDLEKESLDIEEKKLAVIEAQKALEDAKNARGVYRLNAETGQFEWVQDEKEVKNAEETLQQAIEELNQYVEEQAWDGVIDELESGNATNESILAILSQWMSESYGNETPEWLSSILNTIKHSAGVDLVESAPDSEVAQAIKNGSFDSGGIASGLGFLPKATSRPESVNDPALTAKILSPTSNAQFDRYVRDMGIMFEQARTYAQTPVLQSAAGNSVVTTTNNSTYINGVKIGSDMMSKPFGEVLQMVSMVPTK